MGGRAEDMREGPHLFLWGKFTVIRRKRLRRDCAVSDNTGRPVRRRGVLRGFTVRGCEEGFLGVIQGQAFSFRQSIRAIRTGLSWCGVLVLICFLRGDIG